MGGGLSLEANAKVYMLRHLSIKFFDKLDLQKKDGSYSMLRFIANSAHYGGAIYVNDNTNSGTCSSHPKTECFFQVLALNLLISSKELFGWQLNSLFER